MSNPQDEDTRNIMPDNFGNPVVYGIRGGSDSANTRPVENKHISGTNTDTTIDDILNKVRWGDFQNERGDWGWGIANRQEIVQALTTKMEQDCAIARVEAGILEIMFWYNLIRVKDRPALKARLKELEAELAELQAHHKQAPGLALDKLSVRSEDKPQERSA